MPQPSPYEDELRRIRSLLYNSEDFVRLAEADAGRDLKPYGIGKVMVAFDMLLEGEQR